MKYGNMTREQLMDELSVAHGMIDDLKNQISTLKESIKNHLINEDKYMLHFSLTDDVMFSYDVNFKVLNISPNVERILGYKPEELIGRYFYDLGILHPADLNDAFEDAMSMLTGKAIIQYTILRFFTKAGTIKFGEVSRIPFKRDGQVVELISVARDISDRIEKEKLFRESQETAKALLDVSSDTSLLLDASGNVIAINEPAAKRFGKSVKELQGANILDYMRRDVSEQIKTSIDRVIKTKRPVLLVVSPSDTPVSIKMYPISDMQGHVSRIAVNARDVTDGAMERTARP